jgi:hypothetical protein
MADSRNNLRARLDVGYVEALAGAGFSTEHRATLSLPQLMWVSQEYLDAPVRVMFLGKETNGWIGKLRLDSYFDGRCTLEHLYQLYQNHLKIPGPRGAFTQTLTHTAKRLTGGNRQAIAYGNHLEDGLGSRQHQPPELPALRGRATRGLSQYASSRGRGFEAGRVRLRLRFRPRRLCPQRFGRLRRRRSTARAAGLHEFKLAGVPAFLLRHPQTRASKKSAKTARFLKSRVYYDRAIDRIKELFPETSVAAGTVSP